ncbi:hypothetical protein MC7420_5050 [Coleofasciculus chthonoplastes PCC 7420]|uniref:Uncharacterized protein n=1 Tax=Coleofasciculus chthonoplastes PCC 7420 TaxID=118168 RepID=B4W1K9_9CYAN|nr:hypothetical protein MC7420_5050 [Coleofasciculus chthonoplastes PCC 7420]
MFPVPRSLLGLTDLTPDLENLSPNLSPARREALNSPPSVQKKRSIFCPPPSQGGTRGVGRRLGG